MISSLPPEAPHLPGALGEAAVQMPFLPRVVVYPSRPSHLQGLSDVRRERWLLAAVVNNRQPCGGWARMGEVGDRMGCPGWERSQGGRGAKGLVHTSAHAP